MINKVSDMAKKFRLIADTLDELLEEYSNETPEVAAKIIASHTVPKVGGRQKHHWTRTPQGRAKMRRIQKAAWKRRKEQVKKAS